MGGSWNLTGEGKRYAEALKPDVPPLRRTVIADLRGRNARLARLNVGLLVIIVLVLGGAAWLVYNANKITDKDVGQSEQILALLQKQIDDQRSKLEGLRGMGQHAQQQYERGQSILAGHLGQPDYAGLEKIFAGPPTAVANARHDVEFEEQELARTQQSLQKVLALQKPKDDQAADTVPRLVATAVTRFGVLAIVIFLVQILIGLYRYNARTASAYLAEADAIALLDLEHEKLATIIKAMTPGVGFDKGAISMPEKAMELFAEALKRKTE